jgi:hypothetical protein
MHVEREVLVAAGEAPPTTTGGPAPSPLFLAEVDSIDTSAVLALLAVIPVDDGRGLRIFERRDAAWKEVPEYVRKFKSVSPPTVVELDRETLITVVEQLDSSDAEKKGGKEPPAEEPAGEAESDETGPGEAEQGEAPPA